MTAIRGRARPALALLLALALLVALAALLAASRARAQTPGDAALDARALAVERRLLCPQCTNERLDVCLQPICDDMRQLIRQRLSEGATADQIVDFFVGRYGERVRADLPRSGFNLVLFAWVGGSVMAVMLIGGIALRRLRRSATPGASGAEDAAQDRWLDEQLADDGSGR